MTHVLILMTDLIVNHNQHLLNQVCKYLAIICITLITLPIANEEEHASSTKQRFLSEYMFFLISNRNFENRLGHAYRKSLFRLKVCLHYAYSLKFC